MALWKDWITMTPCIRYLSAFLLSITVTGTVFADHNIHVLTVHSYSQEYPWTKSQYEGFIEHLSANAQSPGILS